MTSYPVFDRLARFMEMSGAAFVIHEHAPTRTMADAERLLAFDVTRIVKTVAFRTRSGSLILAALRGTARVDYPRLAACAGVSRRDLAPLSPEEVQTQLGVEPGCVSPLSLMTDAALFIDADVPTILPTLYCGIGRPDRTLEVAPYDLVRISGGRVEMFSRWASHPAMRE